MRIRLQALTLAPLLLAAAAFWCPAVLRAAPVQGPSPQVVDSLKAATAYLEVHGGYVSGSAFCVGSDGYFVTCAHVVSEVKNGDAVDLILGSGTPKERKLKATLVRSDSDHDVALLKTEPVQIPALPLGQPADVRETDSLIVAGYPFGRTLSTSGQGPAITVNTGKVTAIRRSGDLLDLLQMDAELNPGNSGGPVVDARGKVVGVSAAKLSGTQLNFATGVSWISGLLLSAVIEAEPPPSIPAEKAAASLTIPFRLKFVKAPPSLPQVKVWFDLGGGRSVPAEVTALGQDRYQLRGTPVSNPAELEGNVLRLEAINTTGNFTNTDKILCPDFSIKIGAETLQASSLVAIFPRENLARKTDGTELKGTIQGLDKIATLNKGDAVNATNNQMLVIRPDGRAQASVFCRIEATSGGFTRTLRAPLNITGKKADAAPLENPALPAFSYPASPAAPSFSGDSAVVSFGGQADAYVLAGGGRYLVVRIPAQKKLSVIDCLQGKETGSLPLKEVDASFTAGGTEILVADGPAISRWSLDGLKPVASTLKMPDAKIAGLVMGADWTRQAAVFYRLKGEPDSSLRLDLRDIQSNRVLAIEPMSGFSASQKLQAMAAAMSPVIARDGSVLKLESGRLVVAPAGGRITSVDATGSWCFRDQANYGPVSGLSVMQGDWHEDGPLFPSTVPGLAVRLRRSRNPNTNNFSGDPRLDIMDLDRGACLLPQALVLKDIAMPDNVKRTFGTDDSVSPFVSLVPQYNLVAAIASDATTLHLWKFDLWQALKGSPQPYIKVCGVVPATVAAGQPLDCPLTIRSSDPEVKTTLTKGPAGLTVDSSGVLHWPSPRAGEGGDVLINITTADGGQYLWSQPLWAR